MVAYRDSLPQLTGELFLGDGGVETDLIFNHGIDIPEFAAHTLLPNTKGREALASYFREYLALAREVGAGFILNSQTWKAHTYWAGDLGATEAELRQANRESIDFISSLRDEFKDNAKPIVLDGIIGPRGDAYSPDHDVAAHEAEDYHAQQLGWLAETDVDMVTATTFAESEEAVGVVRAAQTVGLPVVVSFTVETDGALPSGQSLSDAIRYVDKETNSAAAYFGVNCAHPDHFFHVLENSDWARRIRALRCNASCKSHAELDESETLDAGDPPELGRRYVEIRETMPWLNVFGGCCGSDLRHVKEMARALAG
jgi:homocysteine S-methyltransferase